MVTTKPKLKGPPASMEVPFDIQLKRSGVDPERIGIWCKSHIPTGKKFGPFMGNKVQEATDDMDPTFVWEIVDLETKEFLFYIDATDESAGNWMRYINCARYFEEQNIVSEQEGVDIIYRSIKDIYPGEEILTWYEKAPLRKKKGRKARQLDTRGGVPPSRTKAHDISRSNSSESIESSLRDPSEATTSRVAQVSVKDSDDRKGGMHVSQRGRRRKVTKYWEMESEVDEDSDTGDVKDKRPSIMTPEKPRVVETTISNSETLTEFKAPLKPFAFDERDSSQEYYQFEMKPWHYVKSRTGRKIFKCDICSSVYRHSFSLKRHYIRSHINYKYVSPTDLVNCCVPNKSVPGGYPGMHATTADEIDSTNDGKYNEIEEITESVGPSTVVRESDVSPSPQPGSCSVTAVDSEESLKEVNHKGESVSKKEELRHVTAGINIEGTVEKSVSAVTTGLMQRCQSSGEEDKLNISMQDEMTAGDRKSVQLEDNTKNSPVHNDRSSGQENLVAKSIEENDEGNHWTNTPSENTVMEADNTPPSVHNNEVAMDAVQVSIGSDLGSQGTTEITDITCTNSDNSNESVSSSVVETYSAQEPLPIAANLQDGSQDPMDESALKGTPCLSPTDVVGLDSSQTPVNTASVQDNCSPKTGDNSAIKADTGGDSVSGDVQQDIEKILINNVRCAVVETVTSAETVDSTIRNDMATVSAGVDEMQDFSHAKKDILPPGGVKPLSSGFGDTYIDTMTKVKLVQDSCIDVDADTATTGRGEHSPVPHVDANSQWSTSQTGGSEKNRHISSRCVEGTPDNFSCVGKKDDSMNVEDKALNPSCVEEKPDNFSCVEKKRQNCMCDEREEHNSSCEEVKPHTSTCVEGKLDSSLGVGDKTQDNSTIVESSNNNEGAGGASHDIDAKSGDRLDEQNTSVLMNTNSAESLRSTGGEDWDKCAALEDVRTINPKTSAEVEREDNQSVDSVSKEADLGAPGSANTESQSVESSVADDDIHSDNSMSDSSEDSDTTIINDDTLLSLEDPDNVAHECDKSPDDNEFDKNAEAAAESFDSSHQNHTDLLDGSKQMEPSAQDTVTSDGKNVKPRSAIIVSNQSEVPTIADGSQVHELFRCNVCEEHFDTVPQLKQHLANHPEISDGRKTFGCEKCDMRFSHKQNLMRHQAVHTGTKAYPCSHCDKKFPSSILLRRHEKIHQSHRFSCPHCPSSFIQTGDLKKHVRKQHPEVFHECGFCTRYFLKQRALMEHLQESHEGKTPEENAKEIEVRQEAFNFDLQMDKAESRRLAIAHGKKKPGPRYACTVCRKRFVDYSSMCRHRSLAHQRPIFVPPIRDENGEIVEDATSPGCVSPFKHKALDHDDDGQNVFYANVANKISENLQNFVAGREEDLKNSVCHIKWKEASLSRDGLNYEASVNKPKPSKSLPSAIHNPQDYNFPQGFKFREPNTGFMRMVYSADGTFSSRTKKSTTSSQSTAQTDYKTEQNTNRKINSPGGKSALLQFLQSDMTSVSQRMTSTCLLASGEMQASVETSSTQRVSPPNHKQNTVVDSGVLHESRPAKVLPIRIPQLKTCKLCRCLFHNHTLYQSHMQQKHHVHIPDEFRDEPCHESTPGSSGIVRPVPLPYGQSHTTCGEQRNTPMTIKSEPVWNASSACDGTNHDRTMMGFIPIQEEPLDLSKKAHFQGYNLEKRLGYDQSQSQDCSSEVNDNSSTVSSETIVKVEKKNCESRVNKYICTACLIRCDTLEDVKNHQMEDHPNVECRYTQVAEEVLSTWRSKPNPLGILNLCATPLPPMSDSPKRTQKPTCTKCLKSFCVMRELHEHIAECADPYQPKRMFVYYYPGKKNKSFFLPGSKGHTVRVEKGQKSNLDTPRKNKKVNSVSAPQPAPEVGPEEIISEDSQGTWARKDGDDYNLDEDELIFNGRKRRRRNYELLYNPHKHIRRREMAEVIDILKCTGCMEPFATISLLERHIPMCSDKHKIIDQHTQKQRCPTPEEEDCDEFDPKKHTCIYCLKQFIYFRMLRKHVFDVCGVRKDLVEKGEYIDEEWEKDINIRAGVSTQLSTQHTLSRQSSVSSLVGLDSLDNNENSSDSRPARGRGRRRRRGNGWYRKGNLYKRKETPSYEWEPIFVLDDTFMGMYNSVEDDNMSNASTGTVDYDDGSNDTMLRMQSREGSQESKHIPEVNNGENLDAVRKEKEALFEELTKMTANKGRKVTPEEKQPDTSAHPSKIPKKKLKATNKSPVTSDIKDAKQKSGNKVRKEKGTKTQMTNLSNSNHLCSDNLAKVKQKLARKIMENNKQKAHVRKMKDASFSSNTPNDISPKRPTGKTKKKDFSMKSQAVHKSKCLKSKSKGVDKLGTPLPDTNAPSTNVVTDAPPKAKLKNVQKKLLKVSRMNTSKCPMLLSNSSEKITTVQTGQPKIRRKYKVVNDKMLHDIDETIDSVLRAVNSSDEEDNIKLSELKIISSAPQEVTGNEPEIYQQSLPRFSKKHKRKDKLTSQTTNHEKQPKDNSISKKKPNKRPPLPPGGCLEPMYVDGIVGAAHDASTSFRGRGRGRGCGRGRGRGRGRGLGHQEFHMRSSSAPPGIGSSLNKTISTNRYPSPLKRGTGTKRGKKRPKSLDSSRPEDNPDPTAPKKSTLAMKKRKRIGAGSPHKIKKSRGGKAKIVEVPVSTDAEKLNMLDPVT